MRDGEEAPCLEAGTRNSPPSLLDNNAEAGPSRPRRKRQRSEQEPRGFDWYYSDISSHIAASRLQATGQHYRLDVSIYPPGLTTWTHKEKGAFFASLARHSRLRPDLIAEEVGKTQAEVQIYLDCLAYAVRTLNRRRGVNDDSVKWRDRVFDSGALEVSDDWAMLEDGLGEAVEQAVARATVPGGHRSDLSRWGAQLGPDKLYDIDAALKDDEMAVLTEARENESEPPEPDPIEQDNIEIEELQAIPKRERNPEEKKRLRTLVTRRSARQAYRRKRLLEQGWTAERIEQVGGPDEAFVLNADKETVLKQVIAKRSLLEAKKEDEAAAKPVDPDVAQMRSLGVHPHFLKLGWDVFDFTRIAELMELVAERTGAATDTISFDLITQLYAELLAYIKPLVYETILLAEQQALQTATGSEEIEVQHVYEARALRGEPRPYAVLSDIVNGWVAAQGQADDSDNDHDNDNDNDSGNDNDNASIPGSPAATETPRAPSRETTPAPSRETTPMTPLQPRSAAATPVTPSAQSDPASPGERYDDLPPWSSFWGLEPPVADEEVPETVPASTETDDEDEAMDAALDKADTELDKILMAELWAAVDANDPGRVIDTTPWLETVPAGDGDGDDGDGVEGVNGTRDRPTRKRRRSAHPDEIDELDEMASLLQAQEAYRDLAISAETARRQRRYRRIMGDSMFVLRKRKEARRHYKTDVFVQDGDSILLLSSDDEDDSEIDFDALDPSDDESDAPLPSDEFDYTSEEEASVRGELEEVEDENAYAPTPREPKHAPTPREDAGSDDEDSEPETSYPSAPTPREVKPALTPREENYSESDSEEEIAAPIETQPESVHSPSDHDMESIHSASGTENIEEPGTFANDHGAVDDDEVESAGEVSD